MVTLVVATDWFLLSPTDRFTCPVEAARPSWKLPLNDPNRSRVKAFAYTALAW